MEQKQIVFFDGVCALCNHFVNFLMSQEADLPQHLFKYAPLQGVTASRLLSPVLIQSLRTVVYYKNGEVYTESTAVIYILNDLGGLWKLFSVFLLIPSFLRNPLYQLVSSLRYKIFGKHETCRMPQQGEEEFFLP